MTARSEVEGAKKARRNGAERLEIIHPYKNILCV